MSIPYGYLNQMSSFALPFVCKNKTIYNKLIEQFELHKIEYRPLVAGNLLRQPFLSKYSFTYEKPEFNVDIIHELGVYVGNNHVIDSKNIRILENILKSIQSD